MIAQIVRFRSGLPGEEVLARYAAKAPRYRLTSAGCLTAMAAAPVQ